MDNPEEIVIEPTGKLVRVRITTEDAGVTHLFLNGKECLAREIYFQHKPNELPLLKVILPVESLELDDLMLVETTSRAVEDGTARQVLSTVLNDRLGSS